MKLETRPFATMRGMDILTFMRDALIDEVHQKRTFVEDCERISGIATDAAFRQRIAALEAAAEAFIFIVAVGQNESARCKVDRGRRFPEWITSITTQARHILVEPQEERIR